MSWHSPESFFITMTKTEKELIKALTEAVIALKAAVEKLQPQIITVFREPAPMTLPTVPTVPQPWSPNTTPWNPNPISPTIICGTNSASSGDGSMKFESYT